MKKIMIVAAAALWGTVAFSVESGNIVGYQQVDLSTSGGAKMVALPFIKAGSTGALQGIWLSSLVPAGYEENEDLKDSKGTDGDFSVQLLDEQGLATAVYSWVHSCSKKGVWQDDAHWTDPSFAEVEAESANDHLFKPGEGLWFTGPEASEGEENPSYTILPSGEVTTNDVAFVLSTSGGAVACANPYPKSIKLSSLIPSGYEENEDLKDAKGTDGDFSVQLLDEQGLATAVYSWVHSCNKKGVWQDDAHWTDPSFSEITAGGANDLTITSGQGLWVTAPEASDNEDNPSYTITVSYPAE